MAVTGHDLVAASESAPAGADPSQARAAGAVSEASQQLCPSCELTAALVDDGQGLGLLICAECRAVSDKLDAMPFGDWPGNDLPFEQAMGQSLRDWMCLCHRDLLGRPEAP